MGPQAGRLGPGRAAAEVVQEVPELSVDGPQPDELGSGKDAFGAGCLVEGQQGRVPPEAVRSQECRSAGILQERVHASGEPAGKMRVEDVAPGPARGAEEVFVSLSCYRSALRSAQKLCLILAGFAAAGLITGLCAVLARPEPVYFGMSQDMKLLPMTPLDKPVMNEAALKNWVAGAISASFNFDYLNWRSQLTDLRPYFTGEAFTRFAVSLDREGHLPLLRQRRALMHSVVQGTPVLTRSGVVRGALVWEFEVPLLVTYETSRGRVANNAVTVVCQVRRMPAADCPAGVALSSVVTVNRENAGRTP